MPCKLLAALAAVCATASAFRVPCANFESVRTRGAGLALRSATCGAWSMSGSSGPVIHRRAAIVAGTAAAMGWSRVAVAAAVEDEEDDESSSGQGGAKITDRVYFDFKISGRTKALVNPKWEKLIARDKRASGFTDEEFSQGGTDSTVRMVVGLYGEEAPKTVAAFLELVEGELMAPCIDEDEATGDPEEFTTSQRSVLTKRQIYKQCKAQEDKPVGYEYSQVWRVIKDERIDLGRINKQFRQAPYNDDQNSLKHDKAGLISMVKNGGTFEFTLTPRANPKLDQTNTVFGRVLEGEEVVDLFNETPSTKGQFLEGAFKFSGKLIGDGRADLDTKNRPLQKITVLRCGVL